MLNLTEGEEQHFVRELTFTSKNPFNTLARKYFPNFAKVYPAKNLKSLIEIFPCVENFFLISNKWTKTLKKKPLFTDIDLAKFLEFPIHESLFE